MKQVIVMAMIGAALFLGGCSDFLKEPARTDKDGTGLVQLSFHIGPARTALPTTLPEISTYKVEFSQSGESPISKTITETSLTTRLVLGNYTIKVTGYDDSDTALAEGTTTASITGNNTTAVTVQLGPLQNGTGTFSYTVSLPEGLNLERGTLRLTSLSEGTNPDGIDLSAGLSGSLGIPSGYYKVSIRLTDTSGGTANRTQIAHIYDNLETPGVYDFTTDEFTAYARYAGTGAEFAGILTDIRTSAETDFIIYITSSFNLDPVGLIDTEYTGKTIIICSESSVRELILNSDGALFTVGSSSVSPALVLQDITLRGRSNSSSSSLVRVTGGTLVLDSGGTITGNTSAASYGGGGVYVSSGTFTMAGGTISGNSFSSGGGVYVSGGTFTMAGGTISGNSASVCGGGVYVSGGTFTMAGGTISGNSASSSAIPGGGGGVFVHTGGTFTMTGGTISGNSASLYGGGGVYVYAGGTFTMAGGTISGNTSSSGNGGGVYVSGGTFAMAGGTISGNSAFYGGGVYVSGGTFTMADGTISGNSSSSYGDGGGVYVYAGGTFTMAGGTISGNSASHYYGGGVYVSGTFAMAGGTISGNTSSLYGGGVYVHAGGTFTMADGTISGNSASSYGGGVYVFGTFTMAGGTISGNTSTYGGGVYMYTGGTFTKAPASGSTTSGIIYGSDADTGLKNTANNGAAVYSNSRQRNTTAGETVSLSTNSSANWE